MHILRAPSRFRNRTNVTKRSAAQVIRYERSLGLVALHATMIKSIVLQYHHDLQGPPRLTVANYTNYIFDFAVTAAGLYHLYLSPYEGPLQNDAIVISITPVYAIPVPT
jgi:hypothetical protein